MSEEFQFFDSYEEHIVNYMTAIKNETDDGFMLTNKKSISYHFNQYLAQIGQPIKFVIV